MKLKYVVPARIAINLYDMNGDLGRIDGGMGFSLEYPRFVFQASLSDKFNIKNGEKISKELFTSVLNSLNTIKEKFNFKNFINIEIEESIPEHSGFGSKTATLLSVCHAYGKLNGIDLEFRKLAKILHRGGTSGLGINLIDKGGFMLEGGHSTEDKKKFGPSSSINEIHPAPVLARYNMPWEILIILPKSDRIFGKKEITFFKEICPIKKEDIEEVARITLSQVLPSVVESRINEFCNGINTIQTKKWKRSEIEQQGEIVKNIMGDLRNFGAKGVGMSSMGPCIYAFGNDLNKIAKNIKEKYPNKLIFVEVVKPNNKGIQILNAGVGQ